MLEAIFKKIILLLLLLASFFKEYLAQIVFLVFTYQLLVAISFWPYINIINKYYYYVFGLLWIISTFLFKKYITDKLILKLAMGFFIADIPIAVLEINKISDVLGFFAFMFLLTYVIRKIIIESNEKNSF